MFIVFNTAKLLMYDLWECAIPCISYFSFSEKGYFYLLVRFLLTKRLKMTQAFKKELKEEGILSKMD